MISGLRTFSTYEVEMQMCNGAGCGGIGNRVVIRGLTKSDRGKIINSYNTDYCNELHIDRDWISFGGGGWGLRGGGDCPLNCLQDTCMLVSYPTQRVGDRHNRTPPHP